MNLKIEQIKQLAAKKSYKEAAAIAKEMSWHKVKDWNALATVISVCHSMMSADTFFIIF